jgi:hypothetical protein
MGLVLTGCATPRPTAPTTLVVPAQGEDFAVFQKHDSACRDYASTALASQSPDQAADDREIRSAAAGAGVGAAAGAVIGAAAGHAGHGAAIGAAAGLVAGAIKGSHAGSDAAASMQASYDRSYTQCMVGNGERIEPQAPPAVVVYRGLLAPRVTYVALPPAPPVAP